MCVCIEICMNRYIYVYRYIYIYVYRHPYSYIHIHVIYIYRHSMYICRYGGLTGLPYYCINFGSMRVLHSYLEAVGLGTPTPSIASPSENQAPGRAQAKPIGPLVGNRDDGWRSSLCFFRSTGGANEAI